MCGKVIDFKDKKINKKEFCNNKKQFKIKEFKINYFKRVKGSHMKHIKP